MMIYFFRTLFSTLKLVIFNTFIYEVGGMEITLSME